jgi:hypothetical protein
MSEEHWTWFTYWNRRLWQAVAQEDEEAENRAITMLYCRPVKPETASGEQGRNEK